jgi:hypothetical protein
MKRYYVNHGTDSRGDHEVHQEGCGYMPSNRKDLGLHPNCQDAVKEAKRTYSNSNGCYYCSKECHKS